MYVNIFLLIYVMRLFKLKQRILINLIIPQFLLFK